jgi:hypothetical protein
MVTPLCDYSVFRRLVTIAADAGPSRPDLRPSGIYRLCAIRQRNSLPKIDRLPLIAAADKEELTSRYTDLRVYLH